MLFIDTSNANEVKKWIQELGICEGVTSNPKILLNDKNASINVVIDELMKVANGYPINVELTKTLCSDKALIEEAIQYADTNKQIVIKIPMWGDGRGVRLSRALQQMGIRTNITCCMTSEQVLLAALAGAEYASLFFRRIVDYNLSQQYGYDDAYEYALNEIQCSVGLLKNQELGTQVIVGSIREPTDVTVTLGRGADIVTVTPAILQKMFQHDKTDETIKEFDSAWAELQGVKK